MNVLRAEGAPRKRDGVLVTEALRAFGACKCEEPGCNATRAGGIARGIVIEERDGSDTIWTLWAMGDGWTTTDELGGLMAVCPEHQKHALVKMLRFADSPSISMAVQRANISALT